MTSSDADGYNQKSFCLFIEILILKSIYIFDKTLDVTFLLGLEGTKKVFTLVFMLVPAAHGTRDYIATAMINHFGHFIST